MKILLGHERDTGEKFHVPKKSFETHWHLIGGTGKGKTTAIHTMLHALLLDPLEPDCWFILDRMGNLSHELLLWMASDFCTEDVRDRLVYIEPAREDVVIGFNPLLYSTQAEGYFKVSRATETILRGWESTNIEAMPRLARWLFNSFWAAAQLGLTISDCAHLLMPGSPYHASLLNCLPPMLKAEWAEIQRAQGNEASRILESTRNRLKPYFESDILRRMFGSKRNYLDVLRFMREGKIVLLNLSPRNRLSAQEADAIGGLVINSVLAAARSLPFGERNPTFLLLDEFQRFVGRDLEEALPEVRQLGIRLLLAHQSFSQLERGDHDLTSLIMQAQSRMVFGVQGEDADLLANELASIAFDPKRVKEELYSRRQLLKGHKLIELHSWAEAQNDSAQWSKDFGQGWTSNENESRRDGSGDRVKGEGQTHSKNERKGEGGSSGQSSTHTRQQHLVPEHEEFLELVTRSYYSFEEEKNIWARNIRNLRTGEAFLRLVDDPTLHSVLVKRSAPGHLNWNASMLREDFPEALEDVERLVEKNFQSEFFASPEVIDREAQLRLEAILRRPVVLQGVQPPQPADAAPVEDDFE